MKHQGPADLAKREEGQQRDRRITQTNATPTHVPPRSRTEGFRRPERSVRVCWNSPTSASQSTADSKPPGANAYSAELTTKSYLHKPFADYSWAAFILVGA